MNTQIFDDRCTVCRSSDSSELFDAFDRLGIASGPFTIVECNSCGVWRTLPQASDAESGNFYPNEYWGTEPSLEWILRSQSSKLDFLRSCGLSSGRLLDIGSGAGYFLRSLDAGKWDRFGVETGHEAVIAARQHLGSDHIFEGSISAADFPDESFDVITLWSSLEHMNDPIPEMDAVRRYLKPDGSIIIQVPNAASYQSRLFGRHWFALDVPRHRHHFSLPTLRALLDRSEFFVCRSTTVSREHNVHALRQSLKSYFSRWQVAGRVVYLLIKPLTRPFDFIMSRIGKGATITLLARKSRC